MAEPLLILRKSPRKASVMTSSLVTESPEAEDVVLGEPRSRAAKKAAGTIRDKILQHGLLGSQ